VYDSKLNNALIDIRQLVYQHGTKSTYISNQLLYKPGDIIGEFNYIDEGTVRCVITSYKGNEYRVMTFSKGEFFGVPYLNLDNPLEGMYVITETPTAVYKIDKKKYMDLIDTSKDFRDAIMGFLSVRILMLSDTVVSLSFNTAKERLYDFFCNSIDRQSSADGVWYVLKDKYTQDDLARIIGTSRMSVYKIIKELCEEGLIRNINRKIEVKLSKTQV